MTSASQAVLVDADVIPPDLGNSLRSIRQGLTVAMSWAAALEARTCSLWRDTSKGRWVSQLRVLLPSPIDTEPDVPFPPSLYFYRVAGASCSGREGP